MSKFYTNIFLIATTSNYLWSSAGAKIRAVKVDYFVVLPVFECFMMRHSLGHSKGGV